MISRLLFALVMLGNLLFAAEMFQSVKPEEATLVGKGEDREYCPNCGMNLVKFYKTNHIYKGKQYCSMHCLYEATKGQIPNEVQVVDTKNLNLIDALKAYYVVGSSVKGTMSRNSKYAFASLEDAKGFQTANGGEIMDFAKAYATAGKDFEGDRKMIKAKRESGAYEKGQKLYKSKCPKINAKSFETIALLKASLKSSCALSDDGELQAVALYLWDAPKNVGAAKAKKAKFERIEVPKNARCPICGMFVAKYPQWVAMIEAQDQNLYFDGVKDMMKYYFKNDKKFDKLFVSDYYKLHKISAKEAFFVIGSDVFGPMGDELVPFASEAEAQNFAKDHAGKRILTFDEIDENVLVGL